MHNVLDWFIRGFKGVRKRAESILESIKERIYLRVNLCLSDSADTDEDEDEDMFKDYSISDILAMTACLVLIIFCVGTVYVLLISW